MEEKSANVYIRSEDAFGTVKNLGAFAAVVNYVKDGIQYEELLEYDDIVFLGE